VVIKLSDTVDLILKEKGSDIWSVSPLQSVYEAIEKMADKQVGALLVMSDGVLVGIVSERDYARKVILKGRSSKNTQVKQIMTSPLVCVTPAHTLDECMALMTTHRIRHLPVMKEQRVLGVVSIGDLVKWIISEQEATIRHLEHYITGVPSELVMPSKR
jgi:CBS domain-containing protein